MVDVHPKQLKADVATVDGPVPRVNTTPMHELLGCLSGYVKKPDLRLGVAEFSDGTGVMEGDAQNSRALTQRPDMMMTVALARGGMHLVNRNAIAVAEWELKNAMEKKLGDGRAVDSENQKVEFRPVRAGSMLGSTHYVSGAITELNWNVSSSLAEGGAYSATAGRRTFRISIAIDVIVTNTITTEIVHARSYKKQLVGYEFTAGVFRFVQSSPLMKAAALVTSGGLELFSANIGQKQNEPVQTAVRWLVELSAYDVIRSLTSLGDKCDEGLPPDTLEIQAARRSIVVLAPPVAPAQVTQAASPRAAVPGNRQLAVTSAPNVSPGAIGAAAPQQAANADAERQNPATANNPPIYAAEIGSATTELEARRSVADLNSRYSEQLGRQRLLVVRVVGAEPYRLRVPRLSQNSAGVVCFRIKVAGGECRIVNQDNEEATLPISGRRS